MIASQSLQSSHNHVLLSLSLLVLLFSSGPEVVTASSSLGFQYDNVAGCSSSVAEIDDLSVSCNNGGSCQTGDQVSLTGTCKSLRYCRYYCKYYCKYYGMIDVIL
jgi:hypothetical protein